MPEIVYQCFSIPKIQEILSSSNSRIENGNAFYPKLHFELSSPTFIAPNETKPKADTANRHFKNRCLFHLNCGIRSPPFDTFFYRCTFFLEPPPPPLPCQFGCIGDAHIFPITLFNGILHEKTCITRPYSSCENSLSKRRDSGCSPFSSVARRRRRMEPGVIHWGHLHNSRSVCLAFVRSFVSFGSCLVAVSVY